MHPRPGPGTQAVPSEETETAGAPKPRPSLLPAFEPSSSPFPSSPGLPRAAKRKFADASDHRTYYPTPVPTSSTGLLPSSPPAGLTRAGLPRSVSALSERAPLGDVPSLSLPRNGESVLMGRSSNSSDYQLSANRHISRVHVRATYLLPDDLYPQGRVQVECLGWNGAKIHCRGEMRELAKGEQWISGRPHAQIIVDVQDTRVMLVWPKDDVQDPPPMESRSPWAPESPAHTRPVSATNFGSSPPAMLAPHPASPISPSPGLNGLHFSVAQTFASTFRADSDEPVQVYQDHASEEDAPHHPAPAPRAPACDRDGTPTPTPVVSAPKDSQKSLASLASEQEDFSEHDEENDPIVHVFGPFGDDLMSRFESIPSPASERKRKPLKSIASPGRSFSAPQPSLSPVKNHVINQLAFSRIHSLPLSTIHSNLPAELRGAPAKPSDHASRTVLTAAELKTVLDDIPCVGEISREGRDAAGKLLESEFYYVPEMDTDVNRRDTVTQSLGKTSLRAARKQHKQYYWKRPRF